MALPRCRCLCVVLRCSLLPAVCALRAPVPPCLQGLDVASAKVARRVSVGATASEHSSDEEPVEVKNWVIIVSLKLPGGDNVLKQRLVITGDDPSSRFDEPETSLRTAQGIVHNWYPTCPLCSEYTLATPLQCHTRGYDKQGKPQRTMQALDNHTALVYSWEHTQPPSTYATDLIVIVTKAQPLKPLLGTPGQGRMNYVPRSVDPAAGCFTSAGSGAAGSSNARGSTQPGSTPPDPALRHRVRCAVQQWWGKIYQKYPAGVDAVVEYIMLLGVTVAEYVGNNSGTWHTQHPPPANLFDHMSRPIPLRGAQRDPCPQPAAHECEHAALSACRSTCPRCADICAQSKVRWPQQAAARTAGRQRLVALGESIRTWCCR